MSSRGQSSFTNRWTGLVWTFIALQVLAVLFVVAAEMVPDRLVADALVRSVERGSMTEEEYPKTGLGTTIDRWSECIALTIGLGDPVDSHNVQTALSSPSLGRCQSAIPRIASYAETGMLERQRTYFRYWHGYATVTRPALAALGVEGTRTIAMALAVGALVAAVTVVSRDASPTIAVALTLPFVLTTDFFDLGESTPHAITIAVSWLSAAVVWRLIAKRPGPSQQVMIAMVAGSTSSFFEMMFLIPGTLALHGAIALMQFWRDGMRGLRLWLSVLRFGASWLLGFAGTWAAKWVAAATVMGTDVVVDDVRTQIFNRIGGESLHVVDALGAASLKNIQAWMERPLTPVALAIALVVVILSMALCIRRGRAGADYFVLLALVSLLPLAWYETISNHSQIHAWFTYRALPIGMAILLAGAALPLSRAPTRPRSKTSA